MADERLRLFFALPCPSDLADAMATWRDGQGLAGQPVARANLHLTLAFLGSQPHNRVADLQALAAGLQPQAFSLKLSHLQRLGDDYLCLVPRAAPPALGQLAEDLRHGLRALSMAVDERPFRAHVTLLRHASAVALEAAPDMSANFLWPVSRFGLYASRPDVHGVSYEELASWPIPRATAD